MSTWRLIDSGPSDAFLNMALDEALALRAERPVLRLYGWSKPSVSIGCFQKAEDLDLDYLARAGIPFVRRITGGRGILHGNELTYSFSAPATGVFSGGLRHSYALLAEAFDSALRRLGLGPETSRRRRPSGRGRSPLCFESASFGEIKLGGRKMVGSAQKRWPGRFMQQGSVPLAIDYEVLSSIFRTGSAEARRLMVGLIEADPSLRIENLKAALSASFEEVFGITLVASSVTSEEQALSDELVRKYGSPGWNLNRQRVSLAAAS